MDLIAVVLEVSNDDKSSDIKDLQSKNISSISRTFEVSNDDTSKSNSR